MLKVRDMDEHILSLYQKLVLISNRKGLSNYNIADLLLLLASYDNTKDLITSLRPLLISDSDSSPPCFFSKDFSNSTTLSINASSRQSAVGSEDLQFPFTRR